MPYCPKCDMEFVEGITVCTDCGGPLVESKEAALALQAAEKEKREQEMRLRYEEMQKAAEKLRKEFGVKLAMVTMGSRGAYLSNEKAAAWAVCPHVKPVDTTGAGDIFGGSAVSMLLRTGKAPEELDEKELAAIGAFASAAASLSTETPGGIPSIPPEEEVLKKLRESENA